MPFGKLSNVSLTEQREEAYVIIRPSGARQPPVPPVHIFFSYHRPIDILTEQKSTIIIVRTYVFMYLEPVGSECMTKKKARQAPKLDGKIFFNYRRSRRRLSVTTKTRARVSRNNMRTMTCFCLSIANCCYHHHNTTSSAQILKGTSREN